MSSTAKVQCSFFTRSTEYQISSHPILVPVTLKRFGLSEIVNHLLNFDQTIPFDFIIDGKFIRNTLKHYLDQNQLSTENLLNIEFLPLDLPPNLSNQLIHDDWISAVHINNSRFLTSSFDSNLRMWDVQGTVLDQISNGSNALKSCCWLSEDSVVCGDSKDTIFAYNIVNEKFEYLYKCVGHNGSITDLQVSQDGLHFASSSWDKSIKLWTVDPESNIEMETIVKKSGKRQKMEEKAVKSFALSLDAHSGAVSSIKFDPKSSSTLYSGSWDHSIRVWDIDQETNSATMNCEKVVVCLEYFSESNLVVTGHEDGMMRLWDPRSKGLLFWIILDGLVVKLKLGSHKNWISGIAQAPKPFMLASASYDGQVKVWDIRSTIPMYSLQKGEGKLFGIDWKDGFLVAGGEEGKLHIYD